MIQPTYDTRQPQPYDQPMFDERGNPVDLAPRRTRRRDRAGSRAGAASVGYRAGSQKARLLAAYATAGSWGMTDDEAAAAAGLPMTSCYWKRCGELRVDGMIAEVDATFGPVHRDGAAGVPRMVCRITDAGRAAL